MRVDFKRIVQVKKMTYGLNS